MKSEEAELIERFLDYLIDPNECIDTYGRTYVDDIEHILVENHAFDFQQQTFSDKQAQEWFDKIRGELNFKDMQEFIAHIRAHVHELDLANRRPRSTFQTETIFESEPAFRKLKSEGDSLERHTEFQRAMGLDGVKSLPTLDNPDADRYELYMGSDRTNPWTFLLRREIARGNLSPNDAVICIGNRWIGEIAYFRENLGLKNTKGVDLFTNDPQYVVAADMHNMPFEDNSIKLIFNRGLINKSYDVRVLVKEMMRVLKDDGFLCVETPGPYGYGVSRLGRTDIKNASNLLRLFRGRVRRIVYSEHTKPHRYLYDATRVIRLFIQIDKDGGHELPTAENFPRRVWEFYNACRTRALVAKKGSAESRLWNRGVRAIEALSF
jgi:SAM-dependent methyltransferase